jgi:N-acetylglucosamine-6-phosphate deacetylase
MKDHLIPDGVLLMEQGRILTCGNKTTLPVPEHAQLIDGGGHFAGPGLIDIHTHAGGPCMFTEDPVGAAAHMLQHGVTSVLPTLYFNLDKQGFLTAIDLIDQAMASGRCPNIRGLYMEGPYLNPKFGADRNKNPWKGVVRRADYLEVIERAAKLGLIWALAPELEGILDFVRDVKDRVPNAVFTVAHSEASPLQIEQLIPYGLKLGTHHTNATGDLQKYPECRGVSVDETVNYNDAIYAELICDSRGIHVDPYMLRLVSKIKGRDKVILISDALVFDGPVPPGYEGVTDINFDYDGEIAGSKLTLDVACRNMMVHTGCSIVDVFRYASGNPAQLLGWPDRGEIRCGSAADLVLVDPWMQVKAVILNGEQVQPGGC